MIAGQPEPWATLPASGEGEKLLPHLWGTSPPGAGLNSAQRWPEGRRAGCPEYGWEGETTPAVSLDAGGKSRLRWGAGARRLFPSPTLPTNGEGESGGSSPSWGGRLRWVLPHTHGVIAPPPLVGEVG